MAEKKKLYVRCYFSDGTKLDPPLKVVIQAPVPIGEKTIVSPLHSPSKGVGKDRWINRYLTGVDMDSSHMAHQQTVEYNSMSTDNYCLDDINSVVLKQCGLDVHVQASYKNSLPSSNKRKLVESVVSSRKKYNERRRSAIFTLDLLTCEEVKRLTGFQDLHDMLSFVIIVCGGDISLVQTKHTVLTWLEE